jgi:hypothetical protein
MTEVVSEVSAPSAVTTMSCRPNGVPVGTFTSRVVVWVELEAIWMGPILIEVGLMALLNLSVRIPSG